jgi:hypothetical protein
LGGGVLSGTHAFSKSELSGVEEVDLTGGKSLGWDVDEMESTGDVVLSTGEGMGSALPRCVSTAGFAERWSEVLSWLPLCS